MSFYNKSYFETSNYKNYTRGKYRLWHWIKYLWLGLWFRIFGKKRVFDFGCADGVSVAAFRLVGLEAYGCDLSKYAISMVPKIAKKYVWVGNINERNFPDKYFDLIVSFDVLEHIPPDEIDMIGEELARIAKFGLLGIYVKDELIARLHHKIGKLHPDHLSEHESSWWERWFKKHNFEARHLLGSRKGTYLVKIV